MGPEKQTGYSGTREAEWTGYIFCIGNDRAEKLNLEQIVEDSAVHTIC